MIRGRLVPLESATEALGDISASPRTSSAPPSQDGSLGLGIDGQSH